MFAVDHQLAKKAGSRIISCLTLLHQTPVEFL